MLGCTAGRATQQLLPVRRLQPLKPVTTWCSRFQALPKRPTPSPWLRRVGAKSPVMALGPPERPEPVSSGDAPSFWRSAASFLGRAAAVGALAAALLLTSVGAAEAARSGGRMGGSSFSGRSSGSYSRSSGGSYGSSGSSSYGRSSGGSFGSSFGSSYSGASRSYGGYSAPRLSSSVGVGVGTAMPSFFISPFGFGYGYPMVGGFNLMSLLFWGVFLAIMLQVVQSVVWGGGASDTEDGYYDGKVTVAKVQVGLLGSARQLQRDLERIATRADTNSPEGLHYILQETVLALLRNPDYCIYGHSEGASMNSAGRAEERFNEYSMEERGKFEAETLVNVGGRSKRGQLRRRPGAVAGPQELIVVTILVAAEGGFKLPKINSRAELCAALSKLGALRREDVLAVEVLWTPEEEDDYFTQDDLAVDYPLLNTL